LPERHSSSRETRLHKLLEIIQPVETLEVDHHLEEEVSLSSVDTLVVEGGGYF
jgi:hypothetical protein